MSTFIASLAAIIMSVVTIMNPTVHACFSSSGGWKRTLSSIQHPWKTFIYSTRTIPSHRANSSSNTFIRCSWQYNRNEKYLYRYSNPRLPNQYHIPFSSVNDESSKPDSITNGNSYSLELFVPTPEDMEDIGGLLSVGSKGGDVILLDGDLGAGPLSVDLTYVSLLHCFFVFGCHGTDYQTENRPNLEKKKLKAKPTRSYPLFLILQGKHASAVDSSAEEPVSRMKE